jgi:hypothetical protein
LISFRPALHFLRQASGRPVPDLETIASERWTIAPGERRYIKPAKFLPGQLDRIQAAEFGSVEHVARDLRGNFETDIGPTLGFRMKGVDFVDGVLYAPGALKHLRRRTNKFPAYAVPTEHVSGALYESWIGNRWFGTWLCEDCVCYPLAETYGAPVVTARATKGHAASYEAKLGHRPHRIGSAHFDELIFFSDSEHNAHKKARADQIRARLIGSNPAEPHPGVFLLRGSAGDLRLLVNENEIAEKAAIERGFRVLDPMISSVDEIVAACAGARVVMGVEGSQLVHGMMVMPPDASLFVIQPPDRAVSTLKAITDRQGQGFSFVVGSGTLDGFSASWEEIVRTLDLALS